ncbi:MFS transporter [Ignatzschineria rhizosphaerae]|uniref:MFS transporter n=1 Tax=Ignatzschineria rhizosphaerae TaxID=2923279 RepID=A0ABY3X229_9GAMM|nr:MFS transporter [Ignatzschineria rhizosphaerae]UNM95826.1 MFS transporter [Ignatzschineria rhizosphaerae]
MGNIPLDVKTESDVDKKTRLRRVAAATVVGSMLEWYDFYLYAMMASIVFSKIFFNPNDENAMIKSIATFTIGFLARPIGGIMFGWFGDRFGRKRMMIITFYLMGICTVAIGLTPSYLTIGVWASVILIFLRICQGIAAGAELAAAVVTSYEHADPKRRGSQSAWPALGLNLGLLLSSLTIYLLSLGGDQFLIDGGWRIPFIMSFALVLVGVWVRSRLPETPEFTKTSKKEQKSTVSKSIFKELFTEHKRSLIVVFFVAAGYVALSYIFKTFSIAYLTQFKDSPAKVSSLAVTIASLFAIFVVPISGRLCDDFGSKKVILVGGVISLIFAYPFMALLETGQSIWICVAIGIGTGFLAPLMFAAQGSFLSRQFPVHVRATGIGIAREIGTAIAGGFAPLLALSLVQNSPTNSITGVVIILTIAAAIVIISALSDQGKRFTTAIN